MPWLGSWIVRLVFIIVTCFFIKTETHTYSPLFVNPPLTYLLSHLKNKGSRSLVTRISRILLPAATRALSTKDRSNTIEVFDREVLSSKATKDSAIFAAAGEDPLIPVSAPATNPSVQPPAAVTPIAPQVSPSSEDQVPTVISSTRRPTSNPSSSIASIAPTPSAAPSLKPSAVTSYRPSVIPTWIPFSEAPPPSPSSIAPTTSTEAPSSQSPSLAPLTVAPSVTPSVIIMTAPPHTSTPTNTAEPTSPSIIVIPDGDGSVIDGSSSSDYFSLVSPYMSFALLLFGVLVMYFMYRFLFGRRSTSSTTAAVAAYSPVPQQEGGDIEMARGGNSRAPIAADEWEDDDWDQSSSNNSKLGSTSSNTRAVTVTSANSSQHGRNYTSSSPPMFRANNNVSNSNSVSNLSQGGRSSTSRPSSNQNSQHGSYNTLPEPLPAIAPPPTSASKRNNRGATPVEEDLFASIGISAAPKIKDPGLPDIDSIFSQRSAPSTSSRSNNNLGARNGSGKTSSKSNVAKKLGSEDIGGNDSGRWDDDDKELDDLINS